jgi:hypothetical protein
MKTLTINNTTATINYNETSVPKLVINSDVFQSALNSTLVTRYIDDNTVKLENARKALASAEKYQTEHASDAKTEEYKQTIEQADKAQKNIDKYTAILKALRAEKKTLKDVVVPDDLKDITMFYSLLYSTVGGIDTNKNKVLPLYISGINQFYTLVKNYADKYESTADQWTDDRKADFTKIKNQLETIGSRLNSDTTENRKGFKYSASSKDVYRLIARATKYSKHSKNSGKFSDTRISLDAFQYTTICTIFRIKEEDTSSVMYIEC